MCVSSRASARVCVFVFFLSFDVYSQSVILENNNNSHNNNNNKKEKKKEVPHVKKNK